jgi:hypothetical protein
MSVPEGKKQNRSNRKKVCLTIALDFDLERFVGLRSEAFNTTKSAIVNEFLRIGIKEFIRRAKDKKQNQNK